MAKAKKKSRFARWGKAIASTVRRTASGFKNAVRYVNSGKWADDFSRAVHRGGAGKRAKDRARHQAAKSKFQREMATKSGFVVQCLSFPDRPQTITAPLDKETAQQMAIDMNKEEFKNGDRYGIKYHKPKKDPVSQAIAATPTTAKVKAHSRSTTTGKKADVVKHERRLNPKERQSKIAARVTKAVEANKKGVEARSIISQPDPDPAKRAETDRQWKQMLEQEEQNRIARRISP